MSTPQQFGEYLLFRKLTTDGLGETYRAGKIGSQGIERVVLLRLFNGQGVDPESLWRTIADRMGLHRILQNPHIGDGVDVGRVGTTPYVAYEYVSGKSLAELLSQVRSRAMQIPTEHALFVMERVTFGLSAAFSTRHRDQRVQHGFLVPESILLSNEGEVRLIGFEAGPGLREFLAAAPIRETFGAYLAPEVKPGTSPASTDDVFSLGALLFELLTGKTLVHPPDGNFDSLIEDATLSSEEQPLPPALRALLKSSLAPKAQRVGDVQQWQQAFGRFISEADYSPTTFNLAFFMHTLFGGEIEQESVEIAREKATQVDAATLEKAHAEEPAPGPSDTVLIPPGGGETELASEPEADLDDDLEAAVAGQYGAAGRKKTNWKVLAPLAILAVGGGLAAAYYMSQSGSSNEATLADVAAAPLSAEAEALEPDDLLPVDGEPIEGATAELEVAQTGAAPEPAPPATDAVDTDTVAVPATPEQVETQIRQLVEDRANLLEARYEEQLEELRQQLEEAKAAQEQREQAAETQAAATTATRDAAGASPSAAGASPGAAGQRQGSQPAESQPAQQAQATQPAPAATAQAQSPPRTESARRQSAAAQQTEPEEPVVEQKPQPEPVSVGDLVDPGPGVTPPEMTTRPTPRYPPGARRLGKHAIVQLRILVDENGRVSQVESVGDRVGLGFDDAAVAAARRTAWRPALKDGVRVKMWVDLKIEFRP